MDILIKVLAVIGVIAVVIVTLFAICVYKIWKGAVRGAY